VPLVTIQALDPTASPLDYYGWEPRRRREAAGPTLQQLGAIIFCTGSLIGRIETTKKVPTRDFSERVDAGLGTDGQFSRLIGLVLRSQLPTWFQPYAEMEAKASSISTYQDEAVLHRPVGGPRVMRRQLERLSEFHRDRWVQLQVLANAAGEHTCVDGAFTTVRCDSDPGAVA
jgi:hypothetical protein